MKADRVGLEHTTIGFPCLCSYQLSYRCDNRTDAIEIVYTVYRMFIQWNSYSDRVARLYLPVSKNSFRTIVRLIAYQFGDQVALTTRKYFSAPSDLHFSFKAFFTRLPTIIYIFGYSL